MENGILIHLLNQKNEEYIKKLEEMLVDFFSYIVAQIRQKQKFKGEIMSVIACSEDYNEDQLLALKLSAQKAGMFHVKLKQEVICGILGDCDLSRFNFDSSQKFIFCSFGEFTMNLYFITYENNQFTVLFSEK